VKNFSLWASGWAAGFSFVFFADGNGAVGFLMAGLSVLNLAVWLGRPKEYA
jgi:hypothetical protein